MKTSIVLILSSIVMCVSLQAQIIPINHEMKNLKTGNIFFYQFTYLTIIRNTPKIESQYVFTDKIIRHDTINNKVYAVFQNGVLERADSTGIYWTPLAIKQTDGTIKPFVKEYLRYPLFVAPSDSLILLTNSGQSFMSSYCFPDTLLKQASFRIDTDTNSGIFGKKTRLFHLDGYGVGSLKYFSFWGPWEYNIGSSFYLATTKLCGALIEGKYYGDSACLVASSTPLQRAEFAALAPSLAPNPVSDIATLRFILPTAQGVTIEIYDMLGREVAPPLRFEALSSGMNALPIEMASLPRGVYAVRLHTALGLRATTMMVKE